MPAIWSRNSKVWRAGKRKTSEAERTPDREQLRRLIDDADAIATASEAQFSIVYSDLRRANQIVMPPNPDKANAEGSGTIAIKPATFKP
jgi:hypothetical protein